MTTTMTVDDLRDYLNGIDGDRNLHFLGSGAIHDCVGIEVNDIEWNNGEVEPSVMLGGRGSGVKDPRRLTNDD
jgi:hypothetical protein